MAGFAKLSAELRRITESPYTPSLQEIHDLLQNVDSRLLQRWARGNACQIGALAAAILEGLELWPFALEILRILGCIPSFRDAVLQQKPMLLDTLLTKALESESGFNKYSTPCVSLLSLPLDIAIPSTFPLFLTELVEKAVCFLSPETIRPIYQVLSAVGSSYLDALPIDILAHLQDQLVEVLTKLDIDDRFGDLLCLGVLAKFASRPCNPSEMTPSNNLCSPTGEGFPRTADQYISARKLFEVKRAPKTLDLAVIRAITACSESCMLSPTEISESLKLSDEIVDAFGCDEKQAWVAKNVGKVKKLHKKMLRADIDPGVQCAALNFLAALSPGQQLPQELVLVFQRLLLTSDHIILSARATSQYIIQIDQSAICDNLLELLRLACDNQNPSSRFLTQIDSALHLINTITSTIPTASSLREALLCSISSKRVEHLLQRFVTQLPPILNPGYGHGTMEFCPTTCAKAVIQLHQSLGVMILSAALYTSPNGIQSSLVLLLEKQTKLSETQLSNRSCCPRKRSRETSRVSLFEAGSTPQIDSISHDWRHELVREMSRDAGCRYESLTRIVGEVCRDLELRCNDAERPLREEQFKSQDLQARLETSQNKVAKLEIQAQDHGTELHRLTSERDGLSDQIETQKEHLKDLGSSLEQIRQEFDRAKADAEGAAQTATKNARQQDLAYLATLTGKDEMFEEQAVKLATSEERAKDLEGELAQLKLQAASDSETMSGHRITIDELNSALARANTSAASKQAQKDQLLESERNLVANRDEIAAKAQEESDGHKLLISNLKKELQASKDQISEMQHEHDVQFRAKAAEILHLEESLRSSNDQWQAAFHEAVNNAALADKQHGSTITDLQTKIKRLRKEREERAKELAEFEDLSSRLVAMTKKKEAFACTGSARSRHRGDISPPSRPVSPDSPESDADPASSFDSSTSSRSGPTPKRAKRHRTSQSTGTKPVTTARANARGAVRRSRAPLADFAPTQTQGLMTPTQPLHGFDTNTKEGPGDALQENNAQLDSDDESFGEGDIFTDTDQQQLSALRSKLPRSTFDKTTTEF